VKYAGTGKPKICLYNMGFDAGILARIINKKYQAPDEAGA